MVIKNGTVLTDNFRFTKTDIQFSDKTITKIESDIACDCDIIDATDCYVIPGLIDTHMHGAVGESFIEFNNDTYEKIASYEAYMGTTSLVPALSAAQQEKLLNCIEYMKSFSDKDIDNCAALRGIHMEGPFFSIKYKGAHLPENIRTPNIDELASYCEKADGFIKILTLAPELPNAEEVIKYAVSNKICVSAGHTNASYEDIMNAITWGASQGTHLYNAMSAMNHRNPNAVGGLLSSNAKCELICDFFHVHPAVVDITLKLKGSEKINMITDSEVGTGLPDDVYVINGRTLTVKDKKIYTEDGTIAGGCTCLIDGVRNLVSIGIPLADAVKTASKNPAETIGEYDKVGSLSVGKIADILILDKSLSIKQVILRGKAI